MKTRKKKILAATALLLIAGCCIWFNQVDSLKRDNAESMKKAEQDFKLFIEMSEDIMDGEIISFDDYTEHYLQLRLRISDWNHFYQRLYQIRNTAGFDTLIGDFFIDVEEFYFGMIHVYYIKDKKFDEFISREALLLLEDTMKMIVETTNSNL